MVAARYGKYTLLRRIASGGMGEVFLAQQDGPSGFVKTVAIKRILRHLADDQGFIELFVNEARLAALLTHPNVVQIFELVQEGDEYLIAMEHVNGPSLREVERRLAARGACMPVPLALRIAEQMLQGLHHAHALRGVNGEKLALVHRDVSPDNVLLSFDGAVKLVDFGIAKASLARGNTQGGGAKGKYAYMPPEQLRAGPIDPRADLYAVGVVLHELLAGQRPFVAANDVELMQLVMTAPAPALGARVPGIPASLEAVVARALAKRAEDRYPSAEAMATALEAVLTELGEPVGAARLGAFLRELFPEGLVASSSGAAPIGTQPLAPQPTLATEASLTAVATIVEPPSDPPSPRRRTRRWPLLILPVAATMSGVVLQLRSRSAPVNVAPSASIAPNAVAAPAPLPVPEAPRRDVPPAAIAAATLEPTHPANPAHRAAPGRVVVRVNPWAEVYFRGRKLGITPMAPVEVPAGHQTLVLKNPVLKRERRVTVDVPAGGEVVLKADLVGTTVSGSSTTR